MADTAGFSSERKTNVKTNTHGPLFGIACADIKYGISNINRFETTLNGDGANLF